MPLAGRAGGERGWPGVKSIIAHNGVLCWGRLGCAWMSTGFLGHMTSALCAKPVPVCGEVHYGVPSMWHIHQFPLCPFSRKVRLLLGEKGVGYELVRTNPWDRADEFLDLNPAGQTPVLVDTLHGTVLAHSAAICEYFEETIQRPPLITGTAPNRAEIRRLVAWFDEQFFTQVVGPLLHERMEKRLVQRAAPDAAVLREAMRNANTLLDYVDWLLDHRNWLAGAQLSMADLAGAAHISVADYLGGIDWRSHQATKAWYSGLKSRPSFRPLLSERMEVITPPPNYDKVDF